MATQHPFLTTKFIVVCFKFKVLFLAKAVNIKKDESPSPPTPQKKSLPLSEGKNP